MQTRAERVAQFDEVVELAQYSNLALKWCHAPQWRQPIGSNLPGRSGRGGRSQDLGHCYGEQRIGKLRRAEGQHVPVLVIAVVILLAKVTLGVAFGSAWGASHGARTVVHRSRP